MNNKAPIFIFGNPRSGTTLLRLMLNTHSRITIPPESGFLLWWFKKYKAWEKEDSSNQGRIDEYINDLKTSKKIETWKLDYNLLKKLIDEIRPANYSELSALPYRTYALNRNKEIIYWGDKNNYYIRHLDDLLLLYPFAFFIHIIRDGRDVACSYQALKQIETDSPYKPVLPFEIKSIAKEWLESNLSINKFLNKVLINKKIIIRYEDLITNPKEKLSKICKFLNLAFEGNMLKYYEHDVEPEALLDWKKKTRLGPDPNNMNKYLSILSVSQIEEFNLIASKALTDYGYTI